MKKKIETFQDQIHRLFINFKDNTQVKTVTLQVTEDCNLCCTYCYQINKSKNKMTFEVAKKFIDMLFLDQNDYINTSNTFGIIFDFI